MATILQNIVLNSIPSVKIIVFRFHFQLTLSPINTKPALVQTMVKLFNSILLENAYLSEENVSILISSSTFSESKEQ